MSRGIVSSYAGSKHMEEDICILKYIVCLYFELNICEIASSFRDLFGLPRL